MSRGARVRSMNVADSEQRPVLVPAGNRARKVESRKLTVKDIEKLDKLPEIDGKDKKAQISPTFSPPFKNNYRVPSILRQHGNQLLRGNSSLSASCSSDASSDSSHSRASTGRTSRSSVLIRRRVGSIKMEKVEKVCEDDGPVSGPDGLVVKKRCAWVTPTTDPLYAAFHDEEWGLPAHDDNKLFELLSLSGALAELTWPVILSKRNIFREVFLNFDPAAVSKLNERKIASPGSPGSSLLSEMKMRGIIENARQVCKVRDEFGTFDRYIWGFVNHKPIVSKFRYPRQVPVKTSKADAISKDMVKRGFRSVGPTVVYSFMQAAGLTNDHLISCFRFQECAGAIDGLGNDADIAKSKVEEREPDSIVKLELAEGLDEISICSD